MKEILRLGDKLERCGLVMKDGTVIELENIAPEPEIGFEMNPEAVLPLLQTGEVEATWHTHPKHDPILSGEDYNFFTAWPDLAHIIIGRKGRKKLMTRYRVEDGVVLPCS